MEEDTDLDELLDQVERLEDEGRFAEALPILDEALEAEWSPPLDAREQAWIRFQRGVCLDRLGRAAQADAEFRRAAALAPGEYEVPLRLGMDEFSELVEGALDAIPAGFRRYLAQVVVEARDYPRDSDADPFLLGLYIGVPRTERPPEWTDNLDRVFIFKRNLEIEFPNAAVLREEVRKTVVHEVAHHFGLTEEEMGEYA